MLLPTCTVSLLNSQQDSAQTQRSLPCPQQSTVLLTAFLCYSLPNLTAQHSQMTDHEAQRWTCEHYWLKTGCTHRGLQQHCIMWKWNRRSRWSVQRIPMKTRLSVCLEGQMRKLERYCEWISCYSLSSYGGFSLKQEQVFETKLQLSGYSHRLS